MRSILAALAAVIAFLALAPEAFAQTNVKVVGGSIVVDGGTIVPAGVDGGPVAVDVQAFNGSPAITPAPGEPLIMVEGRGSAGTPDGGVVTIQGQNAVGTTPTSDPVVVGGQDALNHVRIPFVDPSGYTAVRGASQGTAASTAPVGIGGSDYGTGCSGGACAQNAKVSSVGTVTTGPSQTTSTIAPTGGNLTASTATQVYAGASTTCQVAVSNLSSSIAMTCGQTNAVSATIGLYVGPLQTYTTTLGYGGTVFCFPASGTPAYSTQPTACSP